MPFILVVFPADMSWLASQRRSRVSQQLVAFLVKTNHRVLRMVGLRIQRQNVFRPAQEFGCNGREYTSF
jgi:hypothetical protein